MDPYLRPLVTCCFYTAIIMQKKLYIHIYIINYSGEGKVIKEKKTKVYTHPLTRAPTQTHKPTEYTLVKRKKKKKKE